MTAPMLAAALFVCVVVAPLVARAADEVKRPRVLGLSHVALFVKDVEQSRAFYKGFLGYDEPFSVNDPDGKLHLTWIKINDLQTIELFPEREASSDRLNHVALLVDDAEAMRAFLASKGVTVPDKVPKGRIGNSNFTIKDPDGHGVEIVQYEPDGWTVREKGKFLPDTRIAPRMSHAGILVGDLARSQKFYGDLFGMRETWRGSRDGKLLSWVNLAVPDGNDYLELMLYDQEVTPERMLVAHHICLELPDVAKAEEILKSRTLPPGCKPMTAAKVGRNGKRQINLFDPDGTRVEVMEPSPADGKPVPPSTAPVPTTQPR
jgi:catechol 2,3-dioxygenase-like lactoylglutathione lyase family enzyme